MNAIHLLQAPSAPPARVALPTPSVAPPAPSGPDTWAPPPPAPGAPPSEAPRSRRGLILPIVAAIVLVVGLGLAVGGLAARGSAKASADRVAAQLVTVTQDRDLMVTDVGRATADVQDQQAALTASTAEAQRVNGLTPTLMAAADRMQASAQAKAEAEAAYEVALAANDYNAGTRAVDAYNAANAEGNAAIADFETTMMQILLALPDGVVVNPA